VPSAAAPANAPTSPAVTPVANLTWDGYVGPLFQSKCAACHGESGGLSLASYADMLKGGKDGTIFVPGDAGASLLVNVQSAGDHPGQLSAEELAQIKAWIDRGAPER
jgi:mono/diheme cytochrome c family protein